MNKRDFVKGLLAATVIPTVFASDVIETSQPIVPSEIIYADGYFYVMMTNGVKYTSYDGTTWMNQ